ncbi:hypothetical protein AB0F45_37490 [Streptomyces achromogenes]|uniref:hypothetical protein n=1 Tax=Streptomyces achromogenes TaxID=67255 RepID=UPI0033C38570
MLVRSLTALACGAVAALTLGVSPASAAPAASCDGALVLWDNINYNGTHICFGSWESCSCA